MIGPDAFKKLVAAALALLCASAAAAQLLPQVPTVGGIARDVGRIGTGLLQDTLADVDRIGASARELADLRLKRLRDIVRAAPDILEMTDLGPAVRGEIVSVDPSAATLAAAERQGFVILAEERIEELGIRAVKLRPPTGLSLDRALNQLRRIAPEGEFTANHLHLQSGSAQIAALAAAPSMAGQGSGSGGAAAIGIIDGGVAAHPALPGSAEQRGFARGAPVANAHATAIASLAAGSGPVRGAAPRAPLYVADIYGNDPTGGNSVALARAIGWMAERRVPVVAISLVGPANPLVAKAVAQAQARGVHLVAAVGNDGPAAPPAYPASYPGVIAVTGVDGRNRALPEAGRALQLDFSAPGADIAAAGLGRRLVRVRGTSYAVPFVAGRMAAAIARGAPPLPALQAEAEDLGPRGPDKIYGHGLLCGSCRTSFSKK